MIISFCSQKGGVGKSTLAIHIADAIASTGSKVILVDADPQLSAGRWASARVEALPFPIAGMARNTLHRDLPVLMEGYSHAVIDTPPRVSAITRSAILASDLIIVPVQPSSYDVWANAETVDLIEESKQFKESIKAVFLINRKISKTSIGREVVSALKDYPIPVLKTSIGQRVVFAESASGYTVAELQPSGEAAKEVVRLSKELLNLMGCKSW